MILNLIEEDVDMNNNFRVEGFIDIELINKKDNVRRVFRKHNTLTRGGAQMFFARSAGTLLKMAGDSFGQTYCFDNWTGRSTNARYSRDEDTPITNVLANIDSTIASNMQDTATFLDVYTDAFDNTDKVVGYANINLSPDNDGKQGTVDYSKGEYVVDGYTRAMRWYYKQGVASGTFNCIGMMGKPLATSPYPVDNGCLFGKIIDKVNRCYANYLNNSTAFCPPGITGITDNDTILLNFNQDNISRWKYSISTGDVTEVPASETFWVPFEYKSSYGCVVDYFVDSGYLYILYLASKDGSSSSYTVAVYDTSTQSLVTSYKRGGSGYYVNNCHFLKYNNNVYVAWNSSVANSGNSSQTSRASKLSKSGAYYNSMSNVTDLETELGITLPTGLDKNIVSFGNYGSNYIVSIGDAMIITSSLSDIHANMIEQLPPLDMGKTKVLVPFSAGSNLGFISVGCPKSSAGSTSLQSDYVTDGYWTTKMNSPTTAYVSSFLDSGIFLSLDGWWTSLLSFAILSTPITKGDDDEMYITYGYKVVL